MKALRLLVVGLALLLIFSIGYFAGGHLFE